MKLSVIVIAYNQEQYIEQTIRSIAMQKTNFDFEIIVGDDCSTDKTNEILQNLAKEIPNLKVISHKRNLGIVGNFMSVYNAANSEYTAETGGDDYWIDEQKLQKGVDFLDANQEYSLFFTGYKTYFQNENIFEDVLLGKDKDVSFDFLCKKNPICATTTLYRKELIPKLNETFSNAPVEDWVLWVMYAQKGKVRYSNKVTSVYRVHDESVYSSIDFIEGLLWKFEARSYIWKKFGNENSKEFFIAEKRNIQTILCSKTTSVKRKVLFFSKIEELGVLKQVKLIKRLIILNNRIGRSLLWRLFDKIKFK